MFPNWSGRVESHANIWNRAWVPLSRRAGLMAGEGLNAPKYKIYALRHVKASVEIAIGKTPKQIQQIMGHEDIKVTFDTYGHLFKDLEQDIDRNGMERFLSGQN